ncbi:MAG: trypsin-like serine protease [Polyangiaceae bacterium]
MALLRSHTLVALLLASTSVVACSASSEDPSEDESNPSALVNGTTSGASDDAVVGLFRRGDPWCAATLIGQNVLLTALHCVADLDTSGQEAMVGQVFQPNELTVHIGTKPAVASAANVSRIVVPDNVKNANGPVPLKSNDIALVYVQPIDPAFSKLKPATLATNVAASDTSVNVIGYTQVQIDPFGIFTSLERQRRDGVYVWAGAAEHSLVRADLDDGRSFYWRNRVGEFTTETVACGSDSGGPAFDASGKLVGVVSGVVGACVGGSLSVFTDIASHADFVKQATQTAGKLCLTDSQCGNATSGKVCDAKTNRCVLGCRSASNGCATGATCSAQGAAPGTIGICRTTSTTNDPSDPQYNNGPYTAPAGATCPGDPLCPPSQGTRECQVDTDCKGVYGSKPRVCDIPRGRCLDGCRVSVAGMCASGQSCGASHDDPLIGACQAAAVTPPAPNTPPASPPTLPPETVPTSTQPDSVVSPGTDPTAAPDAGPTTKKKKNGAKSDGGGCSMSSGSTQGSSLAGFGLVMGLALAARRRRR